MTCASRVAGDLERCPTSPSSEVKVCSALSSFATVNSAPGFDGRTHVELEALDDHGCFDPAAVAADGCRNCCRHRRRRRRTPRARGRGQRRGRSQPGASSWWRSCLGLRTRTAEKVHEAGRAPARQRRCAGSRSCPPRSKMPGSRARTAARRRRRDCRMPLATTAPRARRLPWPCRAGACSSRSTRAC